MINVAQNQKSIETDQSLAERGGTLQRVHQSIIGNACEADADSLSESIVGSFKNIIKLFIARKMLLLSLTFLYTSM